MALFAAHHYRRAASASLGKGRQLKTKDYALWSVAQARIGVSVHNFEVYANRCRPVSITNKQKTPCCRDRAGAGAALTEH
jgi:hypothetical protein